MPYFGESCRRARAGDSRVAATRFFYKDAAMTQPAKAQEPSMEEILASIRRIIADDDAAKPPPKAPAKPAEPVSVKAAAPAAAETAGRDEMDAMLEDLDEQAAPEPPDEVLELTEAMAAPPEPAQPSFRRIDPDQQDVVFDEVVAPPPAPPTPPRVPALDSPLLSNAASAAVHSAFGTLAHSVLAQNPRTLEDLVKEMLRPMLKAWLDDNLPVMVERLVRAEIERVSRGPRG
jgi:cell pole-organizing protein PopZ